MSPFARAPALTQEEFAARYHTPLGTLRDWEHGRSERDQPTKAYLTVISRATPKVSSGHCILCAPNWRMLPRFGGPQTLRSGPLGQLRPCVRGK
jgi:hypothetical protein